MTQSGNFVLWFDNLRLGPGESGIFFEEKIFRASSNGYWFTVIATNPPCANDQMIEITNVFYVVKSKPQAADGTETLNLQVYVTVRNFNPTASVAFQLYKAEINRWQMVAQG